MTALPQTYDLPPSATHAHRRCHWLADLAGKCLGTLTIAQGRSTKDVATYRVEEVDANGADGRAFLLTRTGEELAYVVFLARNGQDDGCTCLGFHYGKGRPCKHVAAMKELLHAGDLDPRPDPFPSPEQVADDAGRFYPPCFRGAGLSWGADF